MKELIGWANFQGCRSSHFLLCTLLSVSILEVWWWLCARHWFHVSLIFLKGFLNDHDAPVNGEDPPNKNPNMIPEYVTVGNIAFLIACLETTVA